MSAPDAEKARNREIANNEERRKAVGAVRVSSWAILATLAIATIVIGIVWAWTHR